MAEIKTSYRNRLSRLMKLVQPLRYSGVLFNIQPTVDYHKVMQEWRNLYEVLAGNVTLSIIPDELETITIAYGRIYMLNGATITNRKLRIMLYNEEETALYATNDYLTVTASNDAELFINHKDISEYLDIDADTEFHYSPNKAVEGMQHRFVYVNGKLNDTVAYRMKLIIEPMTKEFI